MSRESSKIRAIGGNRYTVAINSELNQVDFEVTKPCMGLLMRIDEIDDVHLRMHIEQSNGQRISMISDIALKDYLFIMQKLTDRCQVRRVEDTDQKAWYQFLLPFSLNGDLDLNEDTKIMVQLFQKEPGENGFKEVKAYFEHYALGNLGYPIQIDKMRILQSDDFKVIDTKYIDYLLIPSTVSFDYLQFPTENLKGIRRKSQDQFNYEMAIHNLRNDIELANDGILVDTRSKNDVSISHLNDDDIFIYKIDVEHEEEKPTKINKNNILPEPVLTESEKIIRKATLSDIKINRVDL